jgi:hypothetical protein
VTCTGAAGWRDSSLILRQQLLGDFNIQAEFDNLRLDTLTTANGGVSLNINTLSPIAVQYRIGRRAKSGGVQLLESQSTFDGIDGKRNYVSRELSASDTSGAVRAVRRGSLLHYFWRPAGATTWRFVETIPLGRSDYAVDGVLLQTSVNDGKEQSVSVRWKSLTIHAEGLQAR